MPKYSFPGFVAALAAVAAGCAGDGQAATDADYDDVAQALSAVVATDNNVGEIGSVYDATDIALGTPKLDLELDASGQIVGNRLGLSYIYSAECSNAAGEQLPECDLTTDSASVAVTWSGDLTTPHLSAAVSHEGDLQLARLQSGLVRVSGGGDFEYDASFKSLFRQGERHYHLGYSVEYADLKVSRLPLRIVGGNARYTIDAQRARDAQAVFRMSGNVEFQWDGSAVLTLDGAHRYAIDVDSGIVARF